jgi:AbiV family abortive infection protein
MSDSRQALKCKYFEIYKHAHNNAVDLLKEAKILLEKQCYPRAYFLAFTALEEISKSQHAADVFTGLTTEDNFNKSFKNHKDKIGRVAWAHDDASSYPNNFVWVGPDVGDVIRIVLNEPQWEKRQASLYVDITDAEKSLPKEKITENDVREIVQVVDVALRRILEVEYLENQIGTKGFMK